MGDCCRKIRENFINAFGNSLREIKIPAVRDGHPLGAVIPVVSGPLSKEVSKLFLNREAKGVTPSDILNMALK